MQQRNAFNLLLKANTVENSIDWILHKNWIIFYKKIHTLWWLTVGVFSRFRSITFARNMSQNWKTTFKNGFEFQDKIGAKRPVCGRTFGKTYRKNRVAGSRLFSAAGVKRLSKIRLNIHDRQGKPFLVKVPVLLSRLFWKELVYEHQLLYLSRSWKMQLSSHDSPNFLTHTDHCLHILNGIKKVCCCRRRHTSSRNQESCNLRQLEFRLFWRLAV